MITVEQFVEMVSRKVQLRKTGNRFVGRCPFHGPDLHPSFNVFCGRDGRPRWHCFSCGARGDSIDWARTVNGKTYREAGGLKPDPEIQRERERQKRRDKAINEFRDRNPDSTIPDELLLVDG